MEIGPYAGTVDERRADDRELDPGVARRLGQRLFGGELAVAIWGFGARLVAGLQRPPRRGRHAHRDDRAEIDEAAGAGPRRGAGERGRCGRLWRQRRRVGGAVGALRQMDDDVDADPAQRPTPIAVGGDVAEQQPLRRTGRRLRAAQARDGPVAAFGKTAAQSAPDKPRRAGHQDARHRSTPFPIVPLTLPMH